MTEPWANGSETDDAAVKPMALPPRRWRDPTHWWRARWRTGFGAPSSHPSSPRCRRRMPVIAVSIGRDQSGVMRDPNPLLLAGGRV